MRFPLIAAAIVALSLIACNGPERPASGTGADNTLVETPEYTGVIFTENAASEFRELFGQDVTGFWEPSIDDVSRAEECIRRFLVSAQDDPEVAAYQKEDAAFVLENLANYRRQYVGIVVDAEKRIWTNAFYSEGSFPDWERMPVYVLDGGNDFWEIEYIPLEDACVDFHVHGEA